ncbi:hypothetical protein DL766_005178 [Monosporascus sp. MC13-8B]|uniref:Uncharacterized protein n=1 Tax=Monosporascus cannonballus TaxID=155416 RepID=A0ABY0HK19_9PEZI|nr:hypothetical protein DL763_005706 [Monosporascus cannonballus]RYO94282.1 hypothetical protein DL762_000606 [Monosporascus cannonballus]RYP29879.1 hypothetical protein DL766_005178 [Monosporascus sp. MC13-8B]
MLIERMSLKQASLATATTPSIPETSTGTYPSDATTTSGPGVSETTPSSRTAASTILEISPITLSEAQSSPPAPSGAGFEGSTLAPFVMIASPRVLETSLPVLLRMMKLQPQLNHNHHHDHYNHYNFAHASSTSSYPSWLDSATENTFSWDELTKWRSTLDTAEDRISQSSGWLNGLVPVTKIVIPVQNQQDVDWGIRTGASSYVKLINLSHTWRSPITNYNNLNDGERDHHNTYYCHSDTAPQFDSGVHGNTLAFGAFDLLN